MKKLSFRIIVLASSFLLSSCGEKERDVQYYIDHPEIRRETMGKCHEESKYHIPKINCENAEKARKKAFDNRSGGYKSIYK